MSSAPTARTAPAASTTPARRPSQTRRAAGWLLSSHLYMAAWFWGVVVVGVAIGLVLVGGDTPLLGSGVRVGGDDGRTSLVSVAVQAAVWFTFAMAIALSLRQLDAHVAAGLTRRSFLRANLLTSAVMAVSYAVVLALLVQVERLVGHLAGWETRRVGMLLVDDIAGVPLMLLTYALLFVAAAYAGLVVGMLYHRLGGLWGTLSLVLAIPPVLLVMGLLGDRDANGWLPAALDPVPARVALVAVVAACYGVVYQRLVRRVTIS